MELTLDFSRLPDQATGYGDGSGSGSGSGDGYGDGYGYGYGSGYGSGSGSVDKAYWFATIPGFAANWSDHQKERLQTLYREGAVIAFWLSDEKGKPCNGGLGVPVMPGHVDEESGPLKLCSCGTVHATLLPQKWKGDRWWIVALIGEVASDDDKYGGLRREVIGEALNAVITL